MTTCRNACGVTHRTKIQFDRQTHKKPKRPNRLSRNAKFAVKKQFSGLIPFVFPFAHYFIFTNLLALQKENLDNKSLKYKKISNLNLWAIPIFGTFVHIGFFVIINFDMWVTSVFLSYILIACYTKIIRTVTENMSTLVHWRQSTLAATRRSQHVLRRNRTRQQ